MLNFGRQKSVPTCSCARLRQHKSCRTRAAPLFQGNYPGQIKNQLSLSRCPGSFSQRRGEGVLLRLTRRGTDSGTLSLGLDMSSLFSLYTHTHTHTLTGVEDKACGSKQKWHPIHLGWSGSDVPHLILQGLALWNDIGPTPAKTNAVASISHLTHTHTHSNPLLSVCSLILCYG